MFDDVYQGSGENLTQIAHEKHIDACYNKLSKVRTLSSYVKISILGGRKSKILPYFLYQKHFFWPSKMKIGQV